MKCFRCFSFACFALLGVFFGSFIIDQNSVSAVSDLTVSYIAGTELPAHTLFFPDTDYSLYNYVYFSFSNPSSSLALGSSFNIRGTCKLPSSSNSTTLNISIPYNDFYFSLHDIKSCYGLSSNINTSVTLLSDLTITLTDKIPSFSSSSGSLSITENGTYDVSQYAEAVVDVPETDCPSGSAGNYHDDLVAINNSIMICAATCLVIYFFYCIYRMIIKNSGVK